MGHGAAESGWPGPFPPPEFQGSRPGQRHRSDTPWRLTFGSLTCSIVTASFVRSQSLMMLCTTAGFLDLFDSVPGCPGQSLPPLFASSHEVEGIRFVSLDWLRTMKAAAGRPRDLLDLENLPPA